MMKITTQALFGKAGRYKIKRNCIFMKWECTECLTIFDIFFIIIFKKSDYHLNVQYVRGGVLFP